MQGIIWLVVGDCLNYVIVIKSDVTVVIHTARNAFFTHLMIKSPAAHGVRGSITITQFTALSERLSTYTIQLLFYQHSVKGNALVVYIFALV